VNIFKKPGIVVGLAIGLSSTLFVTSAASANGFTMSLTGTPSLNQTMTVQFNNDVTPVGDYFDIWMCPNKDVVPRDGGDRGDCDVVTFWSRSAVSNFGYDAGEDPVLSMKWVLSTAPTPGLKLNGEPYLDSDGDPILVAPPGYDDEDPEAFGGWCQYNGWFFSVNDYNGGGNSNWSNAFDATGCDLPPGPGPEPGPQPAPEPGPSPQPELAKTGDSWGPLLFAGSIVTLATGVALVRRSRKA
jgi:LPXTG-motif cell wall-anchored protein